MSSDKENAWAHEPVWKFLTLAGIRTPNRQAPRLVAKPTRLFRLHIRYSGNVTSPVLCFDFP